MPQDKLSVTVTTSDGKNEDREALMSYAMLNSLVRVIGDPTRATTIDLDPDLAQMVLITVLIPRGPTGKPSVPFEEFDLPGLDVEEAYKVIDWVKEHVLDFFVRRLKGSLQSIKEREDDLKELGSTLSGLKP